MTIPLASLNSVLIGIALLLLGVIVTAFWRSRDVAIRQAKELADANTLLVLRVDDMERKLLLVGQQVVPLSAAFQAILVEKLTHLHTPELDELLTRIGPPSQLSEEETDRFYRLLEERVHVVDDQIDDAERNAAKMLPMVMEQVKQDFKMMRELPVKLTVVSTVQSIDVSHEVQQDTKKEEKDDG